LFDQQKNGQPPIWIGGGLKKVCSGLLTPPSSSSLSSRMFINGLINWVASRCGSINPTSIINGLTIFYYLYFWLSLTRWNETMMVVGRNREVQVAAGDTSWSDPIDHFSWSADHWLPPIESRDRSPIDDKTVEILSLLSIVFCLPLFSKINQIN